MSLAELSRLLFRYYGFFSLVFLVPLSLAIWDEYVEPIAYALPTTFAFLASIASCLLLALLCYRLSREAVGKFFRREGLAAVALIWITTPMLACLPFIFSGAISKPIDAFFEMSSGITTTGASIVHAKQYNKLGEEIPIEKIGPFGKISYSFYGTVAPLKNPQTGEILKEGVEALPRSLLFWRSFSQWLGGVGIVVLFVAILPLIGVSGKVLYQAEVPGPNKGAMTPRIKEAAMILWKIYMVLTVSEIALLKLTTPMMPFFDAITITLSTLSTGGFSIHSSSIGFFGLPKVEWIVLLFMFLGAINFSLFFYLIKGRLYRLYDVELLVFMLMLAVQISLITYYLNGTEVTWLNGKTETLGFFSALRASSFQLISTQTSTGFATANYDLWPLPCQALMLISMYLGGMSGSTAGGMKVIRHYILAKLVGHKLRSMVRPDMVPTFTIGERSVDTRMVELVFIYFFLVISFTAASTFFLVLDGNDLETSIAVTSCMINNVGASFRMAGPTESFAFLSPQAKLWCSFLMILGRLEVFTLLIPFMPSFWKK